MIFWGLMCVLRNVDSKNGASRSSMFLFPLAGEIMFHSYLIMLILKFFITLG